MSLPPVKTLPDEQKPPALCAQIYEYSKDRAIDIVFNADQDCFERDMVLIEAVAHLGCCASGERKKIKLYVSRDDLAGVLVNGYEKSKAPEKPPTFNF